MKKILLLLLICIFSIEANEQGCTISFFKKEKSPCKSTEKNRPAIAPIVIQKRPKKQTVERKEVEVKLRNILAAVKDYKKRNQEERKRLIQELNAMKKKFHQYKIEKNRELKKIKKKLYSSSKKLKTNKKKFVKMTKRVTKKVIKQKPKKKKTIIVQAIKTKMPETTHTVHKVIHKMEPSPILMYDTPWIEIVVEDNTNIYDLALEYYGNKQAYKKIYLANQNRIGNDFKIYNGMNLIIPMTKDFEEKGIVLNQQSHY